MAGVRQAVNIANSIRMKRDVYRGLFIIVEGLDDKALLGKFTHPTDCRIVTAYGRPQAREVLRILEQDGDGGVLCVVDRDHDALQGRAPAGANELQTDTHDLETMLLASPCLDHVLRERADEKRVADFEASRGPLRDVLLQLAEPLGVLRLLSTMHGYQFRFEGLDYTRFVKVRTFTIDESELFDEIANHSGKGPLPAALRDQMAEVRARRLDRWHLCCGHDIVGILSIGLQRVLGSANEATVTCERLESDLRLACEAGYFRNTELFQSLAAWHMAHPQFTMFHPACAP